MVTDRSLHQHITDLIAEEHKLRDELSRHEISRDDENSRLTEIEVALDQSWDLLRQRQARRHAGFNPDDAQARPADVVENYED
ncbi:DUF2630 family protein [Gordonia sp. NPDC003424]